jgi:MSHA type pilus biogenesis protein MshL
MAENRVADILSRCFMVAMVAWLSIAFAPLEMKREIQIPEIPDKVTPVRHRQASQPKMPDFQPVTEEVSPLRTRIVSISARNTPLRDVLHVIAEAANLNLVMEKGVVPETPITMTLKEVMVEDALNTTFAAVDYFYSVKDNMLIVQATTTRVFELGHPAITQTYSTSVGGDILSGAASVAGGSGEINGSVTQSIKGDTEAFNFWEVVEKSISNIIGTGQMPTDRALQQGVIINRMTGTIFVTATKKNLENVEQYIDTIRKAISRQVMIEARIIEVQLSEGLQYGIDWSFIADQSNLGKITIGATDFSSVIDTGLPVFQVDIIGTDFSSILKALQQQGEVRTLSNPRINIMNGQTSLLSVGRARNFISKVETITTASTSPLTTFSVETSDVLSGMVLGIAPYITEDGEISMAITPIISDLVDLENVSIGDGAQATQISLPTVDLRELSTTVRVRDGEMVVIGGLISKKESLQDKQVPLLGSIPWVGGLFKSRDMVEERTELVVLIQPKIVSE